MMDFHHLRIEQSTDGAQTVWLDVSNRPVNALSEALLDEIEALIDQWESKAPRLVLVRSAKESGFIVGADLKKICNIQSDGEIQEYLLRGQRLLARFQALKFPTVAYVHGACLGGGLEFAMAFQFRIGKEDPKAKYAMPETKLGLIPGWGGTQRLFELVSAEVAVEMLFSGESIDAAQALSSGLIDAISDEASLASVVERLLNESQDRRAKGANRVEVSLEQLEVLMREYQPWTPSQATIRRAIHAGRKVSREDGLRTEREEFYALLSSEVVQNALQRFR